GNCPRYLRGVLVIPTEELEALRQRRVLEPPPPPPPPVRQAPVAPPPQPQYEDDTGGRFPAILWVGLLLLIVAIGGIGAYLLRDSIGIAASSQGATPTATATPIASASQSASVAPTPVASLATPPPSAWEWVGCDPGAACEGDDVHRDEMALFLSNAFELEPNRGVDAFTDIADNQYRGEINAVAEAELTVGCTSDEYCPDGLVTREQMATFIVRAFGIPASSEDYYTDDDDSTHERAINAVTEAGIMESCGAQTFCPGDTVTRGETASYLNLALPYR
ncbi:MAG TPA: S-layer homology domain-containing protein, partial [Candidatus Limnocylindria bacterium]